MASAESILTSQMSCIMQDSVSLLSVHFPLSSYSILGFQQSSRAEKKVKAKGVCHFAAERFLEGREGPIYMSSQFSPHPFPQKALCAGAWVQVAISETP